MVRLPVLLLMLRTPFVAVVSPVTPVFKVTLAVPPLTVNVPDCVPASVAFPPVTLIAPLTVAVLVRSPPA